MWAIALKSLLESVNIYPLGFIHYPLVCVCVCGILFSVHGGSCGSVCARECMHISSVVCLLLLHSDTWMTDDPVGATNHPAQPESHAPPPSISLWLAHIHSNSPSLKKKKCTLCLLPRRFAINPFDPPLMCPRFPRVTTRS